MDDELNLVPPMWAKWILLAAALLTALFFLGAKFVQAFRCMDRVDDFLSDWFGDPEKDEPGLMARIERIEQRLDALERRGS